MVGGLVCMVGWEKTVGFDGRMVSVAVFQYLLPEINTELIGIITLPILVSVRGSVLSGNLFGKGHLGAFVFSFQLLLY